MDGSVDALGHNRWYGMDQGLGRVDQGLGRVDQGLDESQRAYFSAYPNYPPINQGIRKFTLKLCSNN